MTTRYNAKPVPNFGVAPLPTGYSSVSPSNVVTIPPVGIFDVDAALFNLFDKEMRLQVKADDGLKKVPVLFSSGEKWALSKKNKASRDANGSLILPLITIVRTNIEQSPTDDITGRGINQQTGELVVRRRLDESDRSYQSLINRLLIRNQTNLAVKPEEAIVGQLSTTRAIGDLSQTTTVLDGGLLAGELSNNVWETIVVPSPQFFTANYEVVVWSQYIYQMNQIIEGIISSFLPQGNVWRLDTDKGYWFLAHIDGGVFSSDSNFDDMSQEERIVKHKFSVKVPAYVFVSDTPGASVPVRRYVSNPTISFDTDIGTFEKSDVDTVDDPFLGSDDPTLPLADSKNRRSDQRADGKTRMYPNIQEVSPNDPALTTIQRGLQPARYKKVTGIDANGKQVTHLLRIKTINKNTGEVVYAPDLELGGLDIVVVED